MGLLKRLVEDLRAQRPDHVAVTGDLVNIGMPVEFQRAALWLETLGERYDVSFVPGNHDAYVRASMPLLGTTFAPWATSDGAPESKATYPYLRIRGEIAIIGLSSAVPTAPLMATGRLGKKQVEALAELLRQTDAKGLARVVLIHHPPLAGVTPPLRGLLRRGRIRTRHPGLWRRGDPARPYPPAGCPLAAVTRRTHNRRRGGCPQRAVGRRGRESTALSRRLSSGAARSRGRALADRRALSRADPRERGDRRTRGARRVRGATTPRCFALGWSRFGSLWQQARDVGPVGPFGFSWPLAFSLRRAQFIRVGLSWISLDFLVRNRDLSIGYAA